MIYQNSHSICKMPINTWVDISDEFNELCFVFPYFIALEFIVSLLISLNTLLINKFQIWTV